MAEGLVIKNKLRIVRRVGRGGMGHVYEVYHEVLRVRRALKQIVSDLQDNPEIERRFLHEAQMMARLEHPHIVKVFDVDHEPGFGTYLLMEFIQGRDLGTLLRERTRFSYEDTIRIGLAVASALDCAHAAGLVHRDIKPANILLEEGSNRPVVTDFGIAKEVEGAADEGFTKTGSFIGTYRYSSREQIRAEKDVRIDGRADVYSLGVVLYEISTGHRYLEGMAELKIASCVGYQEDWRPPLTFPDDLPENFRQLIERSLEPNRDQRVESAQALMRELEQCLGSTPVRLWTPSATPPPRGQAPPLAATATGAVGGSALQEVSDAPTALEDSEGGVTEERARERARLVVRLQGLRKAVDGQSVEFERLLKTLQGFDLPRDEFRQLDDMSQILHRVEQSEQEGELDSAIASLEGLSDRLQRNSSRMEASLSDAVERTRDDLRRNWRQLVDLGPGWVERERSESVERLLTNLAGALAGHRWDECERALTETGAQIDEAWRRARERAGRQVETGLSTLAERLEALRALSEEDADQSGVDPASLASEVTSALERGDLNRATADVDQAVAMLERALGTARERETRAADEAKARAAAAFQQLPRASAERLAPEDLARADGRHQAGDAARAAGDLRGAAAAFTQAAELVTAITARVAAALAAERSDAETRLREVLEQSRRAPDEVAGPARAAAESALGAPASDPEAAIARLVKARTALAAAVEEGARFEAARAAEQSALAALGTARGLSPTADELRAGEGQLAAARTALARRDWEGAAQRFAGAKTSLETLAQEISERRERDDLEAARIGAESLLATLPRERVAAVASADLKAAEELLETARAGANEGDRAGAKTAFGAAAERLAKARDAVARGLAEEIAELARRWETIEPGLSGLALPRESAQVEEALESARRELEALRLDATEAALARGASALEDVRGHAENRARERIGAELAALGEAMARLQRARPTQPLAKDTLPPAVGRRADALVLEGRPGAAVALVEKATQDAKRNADAEVTRLEGECAEVRKQLARIREDLGRRAVRAEERAEDEVRAAAAREKAALEQQGQGALEAALADWKAAEQALEKARERVDEGERDLIEAALAELRTVYATSESAAAEIVGRERDAVRSLLDRPAKPGETGAALAAIASARQALETVLVEAKEQARALEARAAADVVQKRVTARSPKRRQLRTPEKLQKDAAKAFDKRRWDEAARGFQAAVEAYAALDAELAAAAARTAENEDATRIATPPSRPPIGLIAAVGLVVLLGVGAWLWSRQAPSTAPPPRQTKVEPKKETKPDAPKQVAKVEPKVEPKVDTKPEPKIQATLPPVQPTAAPEPQSPQARPTAAPGPTTVAKVEPPPPVAPPPLKIASFAPDPARVKVSEGKQETFRIALANVTQGADPKIEWRLGDEVVARDVPEFTFKPDFDAAKAAGGKPLGLVASVDGAEGPSQRWEVEVTDVNRPPALNGTTPPTSRTVEAEAGTKLALAAKVSDPDKDELRYSWKVDGKPVAGEGPRLDVPVTGDEQVEVTATDGKDSVKAAWKIAALKSPFRVDTKPANLTRLAFASPQEFRADVPRALADDGVALEWTLDGKRAGTGSTFRFANDDPARVRKDPVKVGLRATDATGRTFSRDWSFLVSPPAPRLAGSQPKPGELSIDRGERQAFTLDAADPVGSQALEYVFEVDGRRAGAGSQSTFDYRQADERTHTVVAYVRDNFDQSSAKQRWTIRPGTPAADIVARGREWLTQYQDAFNRKDASRIGQLRGLGSDAVAKLSQALAEQQGLRVDFSNVQVEKLDDNRVRFRYERTDRFTEARDGRPVERTGSVEQVVGVVGGQLKELETRRR